MTLIQTVNVDDYCYSVCQYEGNSYVGLGGGAVDRIDVNGQHTK